MLAPDGRCKTLDARGDGYVRAETCVSLLLDSTAQMNEACAFLEASAVNQVSQQFWAQGPLGAPQS